MDIREDNLLWSQILGELEHYLFSKSKQHLQNTSTCTHVHMQPMIASVQMDVQCLTFNVYA